MSERWFTDAQVQQVARDLQEMDGTMADAMDMPSKRWGFKPGAAAILGRPRNRGTRQDSAYRFVTALTAS
jgi:hypothetical protein